ncbi:MAG: PIN domain-containing protein [Steroidobacteraceae bacterium]
MLVDFENIQRISADVLKGDPVKIKVFLGEHQSNVPLETTRALQRFGSDVEYIQIDGNGRNALDFHIAYYIGRLAADHPGSRFHIVSKDTGFDPLISHLKARSGKPRTLKTLRSTIHALFGKEMLEQELDGLVRQLKSRGLITVTDGKVSYTGLA